MFHIDKAQEKYYFNNPNSLGLPSLAIPHFNQVRGSLTIGFPAVVDLQWDALTREGGRKGIS